MLGIVMAMPVFADIASIRDLIRSGRLDEAVAECNREIAASPRSFALHTMKGLALHAAGDKVAALSAFRKALALNATYEPALQAAAQIEFENRDPEAIKRLESVLRLNPGSETAHAMLAQLLYDRRSCEEAISHFEKTSLTPSLKWQYGVCLMAAQRWTDAAREFGALLLIREHEPTRYNLALAQWNAKSYQAAVSTLAPMQHPGVDPESMRLLASAHEALGDTPKAIAVLQQAVRDNPSNDSLLIDLAVLCMDHKAMELGLEVVRAGIQATPSSSRLYALLGVLLVRSGDTRKGQEAFQKAQLLSPESGLGRIGLASVLMQMGLASDAAQVLREQLAASGPDPRAELTLARALLLKDSSREEKREAVALLQKLVKQDRSNAAAHGLLGKVYFQLGQTANATAELSEAVRLDPTDRSSAYKLMTIYTRSGRPKEAAEMATRIRLLLDKEKADADSNGRFHVVRETAVK